MIWYIFTQCITGKSYYCTHLLTPWSRLFQKLTDSQLGKKFPAFYGTWRFITEFTRTHHLYLSWARLIQPKLHIPISEDPSYYFPPIYAWVFPPKHCRHLFSPPYLLHALPSSFVSIWSPKWHLVRRTYHKAPHYVVFSTPLLHCLS